MTAGTVTGHSGSHKVQEVLIAAKYYASDVKHHDGKAFNFKTQDGKDLHGSSAILGHLAGKAGNHQELVQWLGLSEHNFAPAVGAWVYGALGLAPQNKQAHEEVSHLLKLLDEYLLTRTYLAGEKITAADVSVACSLLLAFKHVLDAHARDHYINVTRWFNTLVHQPHFQAVLGEVHLCEKSVDGDHHETAAHGGAKGKKDKKTSESAAEKPAAPKEEKKASKKKEEEPAEEMDETEAALAAEPPSKDPFDSLPKGTFNMDEFKRTYSNNDTLTVAVPYFWDKFDKEHYSIWFCEYKYPQELTMVFMSCNLIAGMFQRIEKMRKAAFGSMILFGSDNNSQIKGLWVWRGQELAFELAPDWQTDYGSYEWKKLDPSSEDTKKKVKEYFSWEGDFDGMKFNQGKIFK